MHQSHKPSESGTADWLMESNERLRLAMREFVAMWGDVKEYIGNGLNEMAGAAIRRAKEILADVAEKDVADVTEASIRNKEGEKHKAELWYIIKGLADTLLNGPDAAKLCARLNRNGKISQVRQQPFHPTAGILWHDTRLKRCDYISQQMMRKKEAKRLFWERKIVSRKRKREPGEPAQY